MYIEPGLEFTRLMIAKNCAKIAINLEYIGEVFGVRYKLTTDEITRLKDEEKVQIIGHKALNRISLLK